MNPPPDRSCASSPHVFVLSPSSHPRPPIMWWAVNQPTNIATIEIVPRSPHPPAGPVCVVAPVPAGGSTSKLPPAMWFADIQQHLEIASRLSLSY